MLGCHSSWSNVVKVLEPFEVGNSHTTDVGKHVWDNHDTLGVKDLISCVCCWTVGSLNDNLGLD